MPEQFLKVPRSASPVARAGAGDISERELSRERHNLQSTPPARLQPVHPKKKLFLTPVNKFTAKYSAPSPKLARIRSCLDEYRRQDAPVRPVSKAKASSMEDLTPNKRIRIDKKNGQLSVVRSPGVYEATEELAASKIYKFMLVVAWRRRREDVRCLRKTLETQVSYSERLRLQVCALKSLLDSDNAKVRLAMRELERLKQLLKDKEVERAVLVKEKIGLEGDVCAAEDRASEMAIGWRNCRSELECARAALAGAERARHGDRRRLSMLEDDLARHDELLTSAEAEVAGLRQDAEEKQRELEETSERLRCEQQAREECSRECRALGARVSAAACEASELRAELDALRRELAALRRELCATREQLDWWPRPLTRMLGAARSWLRYPKSVPEAILWTFIPARHGC